METDLRNFVSLAALLGLIFSAGYVSIGLGIWRLYDMGRVWVHLVSGDGDGGGSHRVRLGPDAEYVTGKGKKARRFKIDGNGKLGRGRSSGYVLDWRTGWTYGMPTQHKSLKFLAGALDEDLQPIDDADKEKVRTKERVLRFLLPMNPMTYAHAIRFNESEDVLMANEPEKGAWIPAAMKWVFLIVLILAGLIGTGLIIYSKSQGA